MTDAIPTLSTALKRYPTTEALLSGRLKSPHFNFEFHEIEPIHDAFKPMAREQRFDVSEMAVFTFLQAYAYKKPIVMLPVVLAARFQHGCIVYNTDFRSVYATLLDRWLGCPADQALGRAFPTLELIES